MPRKILITSALPYANGPIHLGHMVEYIQTDIWAKFQRMRGHSCFYVCADDAHGTPIMLRAQTEGVTPEALIDRVGKEHQQDFSDFNITFDNLVIKIIEFINIIFWLNKCVQNIFLSDIALLFCFES